MCHIIMIRSQTHIMCRIIMIHNEFSGVSRGFRVARNPPGHDCFVTSYWYRHWIELNIFHQEQQYQYSKPSVHRFVKKKKKKKTTNIEVSTQLTCSVNTVIIIFPWQFINYWWKGEYRHLNLRLLDQLWIRHCILVRYPSMVSTCSKQLSTVAIPPLL